ncbi:hypothetical protein ACQ86N_30605 [Puia sp. P3]|uniref:hypothetical protein n=1 Tax=Puia sp. P3 TaxID=3423952 RepID=UPI003D66899F
MEANSSNFNPMVLFVALLLIVAFSAIFYQRWKWEQYEQRYLELLAREDHESKKSAANLTPTPTDTAETHLPVNSPESHLPVNSPESHLPVNSPESANPTNATTSTPQDPTNPNPPNSSPTNLP